MNNAQTLQWSGFGPTPIEVYLKYMVNYPNADAFTLSALTAIELKKNEQQYNTYIERGIDPSIYRKHPTFTRAATTLSQPLYWLSQTTPGKFSSRAAEAAGDFIIGQPGSYAPTTTGNPTLDNIASFAGTTAGTVGQYALGGAMVGNLNAALGMSPALARVGHLAPTVAKAAGRGAATNLAFAGMQHAKGVPMTPKDYAKEAAFGAGAGVGGTLTRQAINVFKPGMNRIAEAALTGAGAGAGATAAAYPFSDEKGIDYLKQAGVPIAAMALLHAGMAMMNPVRPDADFIAKSREIKNTLVEGAKAAKAGDRAMVNAKYRQFWENINAAYSSGKRMGVEAPPRLSAEVRHRFESAWKAATTTGAADVGSAQMPIVAPQQPVASTAPTSQPIPVPQAGASIAPAAAFTPPQQTAPPSEPLPTAQGVVTPDLTETVKPPAPAKQTPVKTGGADKVVTERGMPIDVIYAVVDVDDLVTSHDINLNVNPAFPPELQPRDRTRAASEDQISRIAQRPILEYFGRSPKPGDGAPIVGSDMIVESGNGRTLGIRRAYHYGMDSAGQYKNWLADNAEQFGLTAEDVNGFDKPMLVRIRTTDVDREQFVYDAGESSQAAMSATEQAMVDAKRISEGILNLFYPSEDGEILTAANRDFIVRFMGEVVSHSDRAEYTTSDGSLSQAGVNRIRNAVFAKAYGDPSSLEKMAESTDNNIRNITGAMLIAAPRIANISDRIAKGQLHPLDLSMDLAAAANKLSSLREAGMSLETYLAQTQLFSDDMTPEAVRAMEMLDKHKRSRKKLSEILIATADAIEAAGVPGQSALFAGGTVPTKAEVLEAAIRKVELKYGPEQQVEATPLFEGEAIDSTTTAQADVAIRAGETLEQPAGYSTEGIPEGLKQQPVMPPQGTTATASGGGYATAAVTRPEAIQETIPLSKMSAGGTSPIEMPELVELAKLINEGRVPVIREYLNSMHGKALGVFKAQGNRGHIELKGDIFLGEELITFSGKPTDATERAAIMDKLRKAAAKQRQIPLESVAVRYEWDKKTGKEIYRVYRVDKELAPRVLAHEIGHLVDWLPDKTLARGNILGHVATLKGFIKTTISEMPTDNDTHLTPKRRGQLRRQAVKAAGNNKDEVGSIYKELVKQEIEKQGFVTRDEIMGELKKLSQVWKPFDDSTDSPYVEYRYSPVELYADAVSVLFNDPGLAESIAPKFTKMIYGYMVRKPKVLEAYEAIQDQYKDRGALSDRRLAAIYDMQRRGNVARAAAIDRARKGAVSIYDTLVAGLVDEQHAMLKGIRVREGSAEDDVSEAAYEARYGLEESRYISSEVDDYFNTINDNIIKVMTDNDITYEDVGTYMFLRRIGADRADYANPLGHTTDTAAETLDALRVRLGDKKYKTVQQIVKQYRRIREEVIFPQAEDSGIFSKGQMKLLYSSKDYGKFSVTKYLEDKFGGQVSAKIYKQIGTLSDIENPFIATVLQDVSILRAAKLNKVKSELVNDLMNSGAIDQADMVYSLDASGRVPVPPKDPRLGILTVMDNGKPIHYYVDEEIAKAFEYSPTKATMAAKVWGLVNGVLRDVLVGKNPMWQARNTIRDFAGTVTKLEEVRLRDVPKLAVMYRQALTEVYNEVFKGQRSEDISAAMREYAVPSGRVYSSRDVSFDNEVERLVREFTNDVPLTKNVGPIRGRLLAALEILDKTGRVTELTAKLAGYKYLKEYHPDMPVRVRAHKVRGSVGTPDYTRRGKWHIITNNLFMFSNINKEGLRSSAEAYKDNPARYAWKVAMLNVVPKLILAGTGMLGANTMIGRAINKIDEYDKRMYITIPLGLVNDEQDAIYLRIPQDYEGQIIGAAIWDVVNGKIGGKDGLLSTLASVNPYDLHPVLDVAYKGYQIAALGINPVDEYRGRSVISDTGFTAGGTQVAKEYGAFAWNNLGGSVLYRMPTRAEVITDESELQQILRMPGFNILGTFLRISHNGETSKIYDIKDTVRKDAAKRQIARRNATIKAVNEGKNLEEAYRSLLSENLIDPSQTSIAEYKNTYEQYLARRSNDPWEIAIATATSIAERKALFAAMPYDVKVLFSDRYDTGTGEKKRTATTKSTAPKQIAPSKLPKPTKM